jgi:hypothetical protein
VAPKGAADQTPAIPADALPARVTVHYPPSSEAIAAAAADSLRAAGIPDVAVLPVRFPIARTNVRFYHAVDRQGADAVVALLPAGTDGDAPYARDFTDFATPPAAGRIEVWLAGTPDGAESPPVAPPRSAPAPQRPAPAPAVTPPLATVPPAAVGTPHDQAEAVARIIVERAYERILQQVPNR